MGKYLKLGLYMMPLFAMVCGFGPAKLQALDNQPASVKVDSNENEVKSTDDSMDQNGNVKMDQTKDASDKTIVEPQKLAVTDESVDKNANGKTDQTKDSSDKTMVEPQKLVAQADTAKQPTFIEGGAVSSDNPAAIKDEDESDDIQDDLNAVKKEEPSTSEFVNLADKVDAYCLFPEDGPYTVFIPSNEAWDKLSADTKGDLQKSENQDKLCKILSAYVVPGKIKETDLGKVDLVPVEGKAFEVKIVGSDVYVNGAKILKKSVVEKNGTVIYIIDKTFTS